jgi:hypothetical protein
MYHVEKRYQIELAAALLAYVALLIIALFIFQAEPPLVLRYLVVLLPVLPIAYGMWAYRRFLHGIDELQRRIQLDGLAFAVGGTGLITMTWGFLELAGLPRLSTLWVFPILVWLWGLGSALAARRYR